MRSNLAPAMAGKARGSAPGPHRPPARLADDAAAGVCAILRRPRAPRAWRTTDAYAELRSHPAPGRVAPAWPPSLMRQRATCHPAGGAAPVATACQPLTAGRPRQLLNRGGSAREGTDLAEKLDQQYGRTLDAVLHDWPICEADQRAIRAWLAAPPHQRMPYNEWKDAAAVQLRTNRSLYEAGFPCPLDQRGDWRDQAHSPPHPLLYELAAAAVERRRADVEAALRDGVWRARWSMDPATGGWATIEAPQWEALTLVHRLALPGFSADPIYFVTGIKRRRAIKGASPLPPAMYVRLKQAPLDPTDAAAAQSDEPAEECDGPTYPTARENDAAEQIANEFERYLAGKRKDYPSQNRVSNQLSVSLPRARFRKIFNEVANAKDGYKDFLKRGRRPTRPE
jgi:hypothetical protein